MPCERLDKLLDSIGITEKCYGCQFLIESTEYHPYGSDYSGEEITECTCYDDNLCPRLKGDN